MFKICKAVSVAQPKMMLERPPGGLRTFTDVLVSVVVVGKIWLLSWRGT